MPRRYVTVDVPIDVALDEFSDDVLLTEIAERLGDDAVDMMSLALAAVREKKRLPARDDLREREQREAREAAETEISELRSLLFRKDVLGALIRLDRLSPCPSEMAMGFFKMMERGRA